jgi:enamine deaminase RidA (YjgF/YER057c/UK114 family)
MMQPINPSELGAPRGYSNGMLASAGGRLLFVAGQIGWDSAQQLAEGFAAQFAQALKNVLTVVTCAGGLPEHVGRLTIYVVDRDAYARELKAVGAHYRELMGKHYPAMALVEVSALLEPLARVEIEATAVVP